MTDLFPVTLDDQIYEVERELKLRSGVYAKWLLTGKISPQKAKQQVLRLEAVLETLRGLKREDKNERQAAGAH